MHKVCPWCLQTDPGSIEESIAVTVWFLWRRVIYSDERAIPPPPSETQMKRNAKMKKHASSDKQREEWSQRMAKELSWGDERCWWQCWWWEIIAGSSHQPRPVFDTGSLSPFQLCIVGRCNPGWITMALSFHMAMPSRQEAVHMEGWEALLIPPFTFTRGCSYRDREERVKRSRPSLGMLPSLLYSHLLYHPVSAIYLPKNLQANLALQCTSWHKIIHSVKINAYNECKHMYVYICMCTLCVYCVYSKITWTKIKIQKNKIQNTTAKNFLPFVASTLIPIKTSISSLYILWSFTV